MRLLYLVFLLSLVTPALFARPACDASDTLPSLVCPSDLTVVCEQFDPTLTAYGEAFFSGNCALETLSETPDYALFDTLCSRGTVFRVFVATDTCDNQLACTQRISVLYQSGYYVRFPDDVNATDCNQAGFGEPVLWGDDCALMSVSSYDEIIDGVPDACFRISRIWHVINWCNYDPLQPLILVPNPQPSALLQHSSNLPGPVVSACDATAPWSPTVIKINPTDPDPTNFCTFWQAAANGYQYKQSIRITDITPPVLTPCPTTSPYFPDTTENDALFWHNVFSPDLPAQDHAETAVDLSMQITDNCSGSNNYLGYLLYLDLDADGQQETVVNSQTLGSNGLGWNTVHYNNANTPGYQGGTPLGFDDRPVAAEEKWGFALQQSISGNVLTAALRWNTAEAPNNYTLPLLPNGRHRIRWIGYDGCGTKNYCEYAFRIGDTTLVGIHKPTPPDQFFKHGIIPNPFSAATEIEFTLQEPATVLCQIFETNGRPVITYSGEYPSGKNSIRISSEQLGAAGMYAYRLTTGRRSAWGRMVLTPAQ
ncbi:MAG: T9SS type A sorting domain-containing protein [Saprospiraceae bacterium]|nr:T9SS type A sorting domain-containing protein [Saprospiraceae bacterium]